MATALWMDLIDPATLTGYARASLEDYEQRKGTLARWLPNRDVPDIVARFVAGQTGLIDVAKWRAYDAPPEIGKRVPGKRVTIELPALGQDIPAGEYEELRARGGNFSDEQAIRTLQNTTDVVVRAVADQLERLRGIVLNTGKATIAQDNFNSDDDFGRPGGHNVTAGTLWSVATADALNDLQTWSDTYENATGERPGSIVTSRRVVRAMSTLNQFKTQLVSGSSRPATQQDLLNTLSANDLPPIYVYTRRVQVDGVVSNVIPDDRVLLLPPAVDPNDWQGTDLGATFIGRTLTSLLPEFGLAGIDQPGIVVGAYQNPKPPHAKEIISDAIGLPVLANAERSFVADVL